MRNLCILLLLSSTFAFGQSTPLSQREACTKFSDAVVEVDGGGESKGSGFIVSSDGYILTAAHVVMESDGHYHAAIFVKLSSGELLLASPGSQPSIESVGEDFALLKVDAKTSLSYLPLGNVSEVEIGGEAAIIGFPFSALSPTNESISKKFCLQASFAAIDNIKRRVTGTQNTRAGVIPIQRDIGVDIVYFQGPSVKGISGSPIISRDTGHVVGIISTKLTGIGPALDGLKNFTGQPQSGSVFISGVNPNVAFNQIITVLDQQLSNGLGSAVGIDDPKEALKQAQRKKK
jgi:S1-C subfamily serine protease